MLKKHFLTLLDAPVNLKYSCPIGIYACQMHCKLYLGDVEAQTVVDKRFLISELCLNDEIILKFMSSYTRFSSRTYIFNCFLKQLEWTLVVMNHFSTRLHD